MEIENIDEKHDIQNFEDYVIFSNGSVYSKKRGIYLKTQVKPNKYHYVTLRKDNKSYNLYIHRLLGIHFLKNENNY